MPRLILTLLMLALTGSAFAADAEPFPTMERAIVTPIYPVFPDAARAKGVRTASVVLELQVGPDGIVQNLKVVKSGGPEFDDAALQRFKVNFDLR